MQRYSWIFLSASLVISLTGCATPSTPYWHKDGVTKEETKSAFAQCRYEIGMKNLPATKEQELLRFCMERNDFRLRR